MEIETYKQKTEKMPNITLIVDETDNKQLLEEDHQNNLEENEYKLNNNQRSTKKNGTVKNKMPTKVSAKKRKNEERQQEQILQYDNINSTINYLKQENNHKNEIISNDNILIYQLNETLKHNKEEIEKLKEENKILKQKVSSNEEKQLQNEEFKNQLINKLIDGKFTSNNQQPINKNNKKQKRNTNK